MRFILQLISEEKVAINCKKWMSFGRETHRCRLKIDFIIILPLLDLMILPIIIGLFIIYIILT
jgi:hypothetical protein